MIIVIPALSVSHMASWLPCKDGGNSPEIGEFYPFQTNDNFIGFITQKSLQLASVVFKTFRNESKRVITPECVICRTCSKIYNGSCYREIIYCPPLEDLRFKEIVKTSV